MIRRRFLAALALVLCWIAIAGVGRASSANLAPGFEALPKGASVLLVGPDIKMYAGRAAYRADWTETARMSTRMALLARTKALGLSPRELTEAHQQEFLELSALHGVVGRSIATHQYGPAALPTKAEKLDWSFGDAVTPLREFTGADYALFMWIRNSRMGAGEAAAAIGLLMLTGYMVTDLQLGHASLVDLRTGRILWFSHLTRGGRDLTRQTVADETVNYLLKSFPNSK